MISSVSTIRFVAAEVGSATENGVLSCGAAEVSSKDELHYINIQARVEGADPEGWGVYFEIDDQLNGRYECIERVCLTGNELILTVKRGTRSYPDLEQVVVDLSSIPAERVEDLMKSIQVCITQSGLVVERERKS